MITKKTFPVMEGKKVVKTITEYRLLGILLYRKEFLMPKDYEGEYVYGF